MQGTKIRTFSAIEYCLDAPRLQKKESEIPFRIRGSNFFCQQPGHRMGGIEPEKGPMDARFADLTK
jgi:hypothetical protein